MKIAEIRDLDTRELKEKLEIQIKSYKQMRINHAVSPLKNPSRIIESRREIARIKTEIHQREMNNKKGQNGE